MVVNQLAAMIVKASMCVPVYCYDSEDLGLSVW